GRAILPTIPAPPQRPSTPVRSEGPLLAIDPGVSLPNFNVRACSVAHNLTDHPLRAMPRLLELAQWLPPKYVRINSGNVRLDATPDQIPGTGLSIEQSFERIEDSDTRIMLKKIELHPEYRALLHTCLGALEALG